MSECVGKRGDSGEVEGRDGIGAEDGGMDSGAGGTSENVGKYGNRVGNDVEGLVSNGNARRCAGDWV
jgi:hypothetical protein